MTEKITYKVVGERTIHCNGCEGTIKSSLERISQVDEASADRNLQQIEVTLNDKGTGSDLVVAELTKLGYQVETS